MGVVGSEVLYHSVVFVQREAGARNRGQESGGESPLCDLRSVSLHSLLTEQRDDLYQCWLQYGFPLLPFFTFIRY